MRIRVQMVLRWIAVLAIAATLATPTGAWAEDGRGRGGRGGGGEVELRHHDDDDPALAETEDENDDRGDDAAAAPLAMAPAAAQQPAAAAATQATQVALSIVEGRSAQDWTYAPAQLNTAVGTTLIWTNTGAEDHTVTSDDRTTFDSRNMGSSARFSFTPTTAGTFAYHCAYHPWMKGTISVAP
jgi:plastocyanin